MKCPECNTEMKPSFSFWFCPNDCDRPEGKARNEAAKAAKDKAELLNEAQRQAKALEAFNFYYGGILVPTVNLSSNMWVCPTDQNKLVIHPLRDEGNCPVCGGSWQGRELHIFYLKALLNEARNSRVGSGEVHPGDRKESS